ncbi:ubiquitin carboxyl-terminal hydrolase [Plasmodium vivax India VII]|uniref:Ubiquitin carboxyl-terminal hydrolase n=6 Tax=Plasmodium vivax TaxID=5855 RepID=A5K985_PLAVS|nr:ubiquitin carboxyl-terminal hydrolase, putative [Plasmodium vivax]KMZ80095.1 ubiquitin carboxyl-terminal hydrolase [Plasmodium vivax India VII]KMZ86181.1 ubiquitin carboxyl-terminal hydrolase [Plasmodium vivax Brazil I]KMZ92544.1 ubiquitin carboxyl-terminal hydrolase [Plasmodium vivax Mauritania I]KMZ99093.1 ubiquitin carboxyl-terminal hydrolase [Plasmodium vivax North Korean]EDL43957.1 ubiquitin carboxyl-terminal hydrolase, putative [Plasmodium vivax]|eukprot:XP_001613684.1 ubiquitin carboxyl-terminal hydrolase [Plasmodium vivax Sal-1]
MTIVNVTVKWKSHVYSDLQLDTSQTILAFKEMLWTLTNVPPEKQKLMYKGLIKDDTDLSSLNIKHNDKIMLVGSAESLIESPPPVVFVEDLSKEDKERLHAKENILFEDQGIVNLGNTCYFNAVLQFLTSFDDLGAFLCSIGRKEKHLLKSTNDILFDSYIHFSQTFGKSPEPYVPLELLKSFRDVFPKFRTVNLRTKQFAQQDAEECMNAILTSLNDQTDCKISDKLFSFKVISKVRCIEDDASGGGKPTKEKPSSDNAPSENPPSETANEIETTEEFHNKLICYMGTHTTPVNHMHEGIRLSLIEKIQKQRSEDSKEDALFEKKSEMNSLPPYLIVHFLRFESKKISETNNAISVVTAKICRKVSFPETFDIYDFCSDELKTQLKVARNIVMKRKEADLNARGGAEAVGGSTAASAQKNEGVNDTSVNESTNESSNDNTNGVTSDEATAVEGTAAEATAAEATATEEAHGEGSSPTEDLTEIPMGEYELISIITHKGRNEESGHYIAWKKMRSSIGADSNTYKEQLASKKKKGNDSMWYKMDDDKVSTHKFSSLDLCGGCSDFNIAILLLYKRKTLLCTQEELDSHGK